MGETYGVLGFTEERDVAEGPELGGRIAHQWDQQASPISRSRSVIQQNLQMTHQALGRFRLM